MASEWIINSELVHLPLAKVHVQVCSNLLHETEPDGAKINKNFAFADYELSAEPAFVLLHCTTRLRSCCYWLLHTICFPGSIWFFMGFTAVPFYLIAATCMCTLFTLDSAAERIFWLLSMLKQTKTQITGSWAALCHCCCANKWQLFRALSLKLNKRVNHTRQWIGGPAVQLCMQTSLKRKRCSISRIGSLKTMSDMCTRLDLCKSFIRTNGQECNWADSCFVETN